VFDFFPSRFQPRTEIEYFLDSDLAIILTRASFITEKNLITATSGGGVRVNFNLNL